MAQNVIVINRFGCFIPIAGLNPDLAQNGIIAIRKYFTLTALKLNRIILTNSQSKLVIIAGIKYIRIPRFGLFDLLKNVKASQKCGLTSEHTIVNNIPLEQLQPIKFKWLGTLMNNQPIVVKEIMTNHFTPKNATEGKAGLILNLEAGHGKTFVAMKLIEIIGKKTLIITTTESIQYGWVKQLSALFTPTTTIGYYSGKKKTDGDIVLAIINSLCSKNLPANYFVDFGLVIIDEVHEYTSKVRSQIFSKCHSTYMLGLSATPTETEFAKVIQWHVGPILEAKNLVGYTEDDIPFKGDVLKVQYSGPWDYTKHLVNPKLEMTDCVGMMKNLVADPYRLVMVCTELIKLIDQKLNIFVFADRLSYIDAIIANLQKILSPETLKKYQIVKLVGGATDENIRYAEDKGIIILSTYKYASTGLSFKKMNAVVLSTPRKSKSRQTINRIFRLGSDYSIVRQIIDIVDVKTIFKNQWYVRRKYYLEKQYNITNQKNNYEEFEVDVGDVVNIKESDTDDETPDDSDDEDDEDNDDNEDEKSESEEKPKTRAKAKAKTETKTKTLETYVEQSDII